MTWLALGRTLRRTVKTLAQHLGVADLKDPEAPVAPAPRLEKISVRDFCREILQTQTYRESLLRRILIDELPPAVECMIWDRAYGKVKDRLEVATKNELENWTADQLEQRALLLAEIARRIRTNEADQRTPDNEESHESHSVH